MIVGLGEILWDVLPAGKQLGGAPANFAYHASQLGFDSYVVSAIGQDPLGDEILATLSERRLKHCIAHTPFPTGRVDVSLDDKGIPSYTIHEGAAWDSIPESEALVERARATRVVCFGSLAQRHSVSRATIRRFLEEMPQGEGVYKVFDINLRQHYYDAELLDSSLALSNILKINDEELVIVAKLLDLSAQDDKGQCLELIQRYNLEMLILTCGVHGSYVFAEDLCSFLPTPRVEVADTVGAGDSFTAGFIGSLLLGLSIEEAHRRAVDISAFVCTQRGAMPTLPSELIPSKQ